MKSSSRHKLTACLLCISLLLLPKLAQAHSLQGCVSSAPNSLILLNEGDRQAYDLIGDTAAVKVGERVKVSGKKKKDTSGKRYFLVEKLSKAYGACKVSPAPDTKAAHPISRHLPPPLQGLRLCRDSPMNYPVKDKPTKLKHAS